MNLIPIDVSRMRELLAYDHITGVVTRKSNTLTRKNAGSVVGQVTRKGYLQAKVDGASVLVHRIAYALYHGVDPGLMFVDHIDGNKSNNAISNLRLCTNSQNLMNRRGAARHSKSGIRGVHFSKKEQKYVAYLRTDGKLKRVGTSVDVNEASSLAENARKIAFGEFCGVSR